MNKFIQQSVFIILLISSPLTSLQAQISGNGNNNNPYMGTLTENATWSGGDVYIAGDFIVNSNVTLTISPGTTVRFSDQNTTLTIRENGTLTADGTADGMITFTSSDDTHSRGNIRLDSAATATIDYCVFSNGNIAGITDNNRGGAFYIAADNITITNSEFTNNRASIGGAIFLNTGLVATIENCTFTGNSAISGGGIEHSGNGGAILLLAAELNVSNSIFTSNNADMGGSAIYFTYPGGNLTIHSSGSITNCVFDANTTHTWQINLSGSVVVDISSADISNCTFVNNKNTTGSERAAEAVNLTFLHPENTVNITNCVFWGSTIPVNRHYLASDGSNIHISYCAFPNGIYPRTCTSINNQEVSLPDESLPDHSIHINADNEGENGPYFNDPDNHDWSIKPLSALLDKGTGTSGTDILGNSVCHIRDIGAYEVQISNFIGGHNASITGYYDFDDPQNWDISPFNGEGNIDKDISIPASSNVYVSNAVTIPAEKLFSIKEGSNLIFADNVNISINGKISVTGTQQDSVTFNAATAGGSWQGITVNSGAIAEIGYAVIENTGQALTSNTAGTFSVSHSAFRNNTVCATRITAGNPVIDNCSFSNNNTSANGAAINVSGISTTGSITNCSFSNNTSANGGAIFSEQSSLTISSCSFSNNISNRNNGGGGAVYITMPGTSDISGCQFTGNRSSGATSRGGAIYINNGEPNLTDNTFTGNSSSTYGGAVYLSNKGASTMTNCTFENNTSANGGAAHSQNSSITISGCRFTGSSATTNGGALNIANNTNSRIVNCFFTSNRAVNGGAACFTNDAGCTMSNSVFDGNNVSTGNGGAVYITGNSSSVSAVTCTFVNNTSNSGNGDALYNTVAASLANSCVFWTGSQNRNQIYSTSDISVRYCAVSDYPVINGNETTDFQNEAHSFIINTLNEGSSPDGPYFSNPDSHTWSIRSRSPLTNAGDPSITDGDISGSACTGRRDIGAYEAPVARFTGNAGSQGGFYDFNNTGNWDQNPFEEGATLDMNISDTFEGNIRISSNATIPSGNSLNIHGQRTILMDADIDVNGTMNVTGTGTDSITFNYSSGQIISRAGSSTNIAYAVFDGSNSTGNNSPIAISGGTVSIVNSTFRHHLAGAVSHSGGTLSIDKSVFHNNRAVSGGAIHSTGGSCTITSSLFYDNSSSGNNSGGAVYATAAAAINNCTFANNNSDAGDSGDALSLGGNATMTVTNSVLWSTNESSPVYCNGTTSLTFSHCAWRTAPTTVNTTPSYNGCFALGSTNEDLNPKGPFFKDPENNNWSIKISSPLRDSGSDPANPFTDILGNNRIRTCDIGAYEAQFAYFTGAGENFSSPSIPNEGYDEWSKDRIKHLRLKSNWAPVYPFTGNGITDVNDVTGNSTARIEATMDILIPDLIDNVYGSYTVTDVNPNHGFGDVVIPEEYTILIEPDGHMNVPGFQLKGTVRIQSNRNKTGSFRATAKFNESLNGADPGFFEIELWLEGGNADAGPRWHYIAVPFDGMPVTEFTDVTLDLCRYDTTSGVWIGADGYNYQTGATASAEGFSNFKRGSGYNYYHTEDHTFLLRGNNPNFFNLSVKLAKGWNLLGNPFVSGMLWDSDTPGEDIFGLEGNWIFTDVINHGVYYTKNNIQYTYIRNISTPLPEGGVHLPGNSNYNVIPPEQGFFVRAYEPVESFCLAINLKKSDAPERFKGGGKPEKPKISFLRLAVTQDSSYFDDTVIRFGEGLALAINDSLDAYKAFKKPERNLIFSNFKDEEFAIKSYRYPDSASVSIPISVQLAKSGNFRVSLSQLQYLDSYDITLTDNLTGYSVKTNKLKDGISFKGDAQTYYNRFTLTVAGKGIVSGTEKTKLQDGDIKIYAAHDRINIVPVNERLNGQMARIKVFDISGRTVSDHPDKYLSTNIETSIPAPGKSGVYIVEVNTGKIKKTGKIIIL